MAEQNAGEDPPPAKKAKTSDDERKSRNVITLQTKIDIIQQHKKTGGISSKKLR